MPSSLVGKQVIIRANNFVTYDVFATIVKIDSKHSKLLLELKRSIKYKNKTYPYIIAFPRLSKDNISMLLDGDILGCSMTWVPEDNYNANNPFDLSWWRGGAVAISDLWL